MQQRAAATAAEDPVTAEVQQQIMGIWWIIG
jgi:hypothetical protein